MFKNDYFKQKKIENNNQVNNPLNGLFENIFFVYVFLLAIFNSAFAGDEEITEQSIRRSRLEDRADIARKLLKKCSALQSRVSDLESRSENTVINVGEITKTMLERVGKGLTEGGPFDSPVKKANRGQPGTPGNANIFREIQKITIEIDLADKRPVEVIENVRAEVVSQLALVFKQYVERKQKSGSADEGLSLVVRNGDSPVRTLEVSVDSIVHAFRLAAARVLDPNLAQLLRDCQLQVVLPTTVIGFPTTEEASLRNLILLQRQSSPKFYIDKIIENEEIRCGLILFSRLFAGALEPENMAEDFLGKLKQSVEDTSPRVEILDEVVEFDFQELINKVALSKNKVWRTVNECLDNFLSAYSDDVFQPIQLPANGTVEIQQNSRTSYNIVDHRIQTSNIHQATATIIIRNSDKPLLTYNDALFYGGKFYQKAKMIEAEGFLENKRWERRSKLAHQIKESAYKIIYGSEAELEKENVSMLYQALEGRLPFVKAVGNLAERTIGGAAGLLGCLLPPQQSPVISASSSTPTIQDGEIEKI